MPTQPLPGTHIPHQVHLHRYAYEHTSRCHTSWCQIYVCEYTQMYSTPPDDGQTLPVHTDTSTVCTSTVCTHTYAFRCRARHLTTGTRSLGVSSTPPHEAARPQHKRPRKTPRGSRHQRRLVTLHRQDPICVGVEAVRLTPLLSNVRPKRPACMS